VYGDYTGSHYISKSSSKNVYQVNFPDGQGAISGTLPWKLPWRVAIVGTTLGPIVESSVVENLNPPCELTDVSWIKSGRNSWSYITQDNDHSVTLQEHYIDFASQMGWEYNTTDWNFDRTQMPTVCQYAAQKKVGDELWYNYSEVNTQAPENSIFPQNHSWGVISLKIDFIPGYDQNIFKWYDMTAKTLAANKLMGTLHGCTVPRGQRRRWPNLMSWEAVEGYEYVGRGYGGPSHNCTMPFTRNVIGPMDITPVLFDLDQLSNGPGSQRNSTDAHELACFPSSWNRACSISPTDRKATMPASANRSCKQSRAPGTRLISSTGIPAKASLWPGGKAATGILPASARWLRKP
jgi:alpha-glucosidase